MNKITQTLLSTTTVKLLLVVFLLFGLQANAQNGIVGAGFTNGWNAGDVVGFDPSAGTSRIKILQPRGTGNQFFRMVRNWSGNVNQLGPFGCTDTDWTNPGVSYNNMPECSNGAFFINCPNTTDNYVFKTPNSGTTSSDFVYFRVQGDVRTVSSVSQSPLASSVGVGQATTVTATLNGGLSTGQAVYLRYSTSNIFTTSTVVQMTGSGTSYSAAIPGAVNTAGANVFYYVFTSGTSGVNLAGTNADYYTINLNNNGGTNYSYTAGTIVRNPITGTNPNTANPYTTGQVLNPNVTASGIGRGSGIAGTGANDRYNAQGWSTGGTIDTNDYFEFTITPNANFRIDFTNFVYTSQFSGSPAGSFAFRSSVDNFASNIGTPNGTGTTISLSAASYQDVASAITFRLYRWGASAAGQTFSINDFVFNGLVEAVISTPEINIQGNATSIVNGDVTPSLTDHTDFGSISTTAGAITRTFTIQNLSSNSNLTLTTTPVTLSTTTGFSVTQQPTSPVVNNGSSTFSIAFDPSSAGAETITVSVGSDDSDENPYTFSITGTGIAPQPEIDVQGNGISIVSGDNTPSLTDDTLFGSVNIGTGSIVKTYTILNTGDANLVLDNPAVILSETDGFSVSLIPSSPVLPAGSVTFQVTFDPSMAGVDTNTILIGSNDANEAVYSFAISATGTIDAPVATVATSILSNGFTANWNAVSGATSYELDVYYIGTGAGTNPASALWNFASASPSTLAGDVTVSALSQGNNFGTTTLITGTSNSTGYTGASGGNNAGAAAREGALNTGASGSAYFQFSVTPVSGESVTLTGISFGTRSTSTAPQAYTLRSSLDNYATDLATGTIANNSAWSLKSNTGLSVAGAVDEVITFRLFGYNGVGSAAINTANWRIDDLSLTMTVSTTVSAPVYVINDVNVGNVTTYQVTGLNPETAYFYVVRAVNGAVSSSNSNLEVAVTIPSAVTWNGTAWSNVAGPDATIDAIIAGVYNTTTHSSFTAKNLTIESGSLTVGYNGVVTVVEGLFNELTAADVVVESNGVLIQDGATNLNTGAITVRRNSSAILRQDYTAWSSPVANQGLYAFSPTTLPNRFYVYNTGTNQYSNAVGFDLTGLQYPSPLVAPNGINGTDLNAVPFENAKGYLIRTPWNHPTAPASFAGQFVGIPNSGEITYTMSLAGTGFNLVGNPYPSPIDMNTFVDDNAANITTSLYFWRETNGNTSNNAYCQWNDGVYLDNGQPTTVTNPNSVIRTGQGFFVEATGVGTALLFTNDQRIADVNNQFFRQNNTQDVYWLNLTNTSGVFSQTAVSYKDYATNGVDRYDGKNAGEPTASLTSTVDGQEFGIQGKAAFVDTDVVPMNVKVETAGNYSIAIDHAIGVFNAGQTIYLKDNLVSSLHNLTQGAYNFTSEAGTFGTRFEVVYRDGALNVDTPVLTEKQVVIYKNQSNDFVINTGNFEMSAVKVFDIRGRLLVERQAINATQTTISAGLSNAVLLVQITTVDGAVVTKKVIR